ncbi:MAG TPA: fluoride efflux transporter CrcB [Angustibacter sp.]|nr:fluoride efflux transporter CrcB [Angustibacter sp.]
MAVGAFVGAPARYLTDLFVQSRHDSVMPWGTLMVNAIGSAVLGAVAGAVSATHGPAWVSVVVGTGFCGALTTFSTFSFETIRLAEEGSQLEAVANVSASLVVGTLACFGAWSLAATLA